MFQKEKVYFLNQFIPVGIKSEERVIQIPLKNTVRAIHRTIGDGIDDMVPATDMT